MPDGDPLVVGRIGAAFGTRGWFRVHSYTRPHDNLFGYSPWLLRRDGRWVCSEVLAHRRHHGGFIAHIAGVDDRDGAAALARVDIGVAREQLPAAADDEYYWADLVGLEVIDQQQRSIGRVSGLYETGAHDVLRVATATGETLIPFVRGHYVIDVDIEAGCLVVDWPATG